MKSLIIMLIVSILLSSCGLSSTRPEKPTVSIAEEFLELLQQEGNKETESVEQNSQQSGEEVSEENTTESSTQAPLKQPEFMISELTEQDILQVMERTIGTVLHFIPGKNYYSRANYEKTDEFASQYLQKLVSMYEREYAVSYGDVTGTSYTQYVCWSREKVGYYLDMLYGGQFSEYELMCDGDILLYYNEHYYIGIPETLDDYYVTVEYDKEDVDRSDFMYIMLEEDDGRERVSGEVAISVVKSQLHYADRYIFEMIVEENK